MNIGINREERRPARLNICQGSDLTTAMKRTAAYPASETLKVWSGEPVTAVAKLENADGVEFQNISSAAPANVWWAFSDYDNNGRDFDNMAIKKLDAIYGGDKFEITTPFFDKSEAYNPGDKLYLTAKTGNAASEPKGGWMITSKKPEGTPVVIGHVSDGVINLGGDGVEHGISVAPTDTSADQFIVGGPRTYTNDTSSKYVLKFFTELA